MQDKPKENTDPKKYCFRILDSNLDEISKREFATKAKLTDHLKNNLLLDNMSVIALMRDGAISDSKYTLKVEVTNE